MKVKFLSFLKGLILTPACLLAFFAQANIDGFVLVANYVPVVEKSSQRVGLYDTVSGEFKVSESGVDFNVEPPAPSDRLPAGYTELEFLESTGVGYVDSQISVSSGKTFEFDAKATGTGSGNTHLWSAYASEAEAYVIGVNASGKLLVGFGNSSNRLTGNSLASRQTITVSYSTGKFSVTQGGTSLATDKATAGEPTSSSLYFFARHNGSSADNTGSGTIYAAKVYENGTLVNEFVPCKKTQEGTLGFYDIVGNKGFCAASGTLTAGPEVKPPTPVGRLPAGYTEYDSVTATGSQYIDTGVHAQNGLVTELTMKVNEVTSSALVLGAYASNAEAYYGYMNGSNWAFGIGQSGERDKPTAAIQTGKKMTMILTQSAGTSGKAAKLLVTVDGTKISEKEYSSAATTANMYLFARNDTSTSKVDKNVKVTVYSLKFTLNGELKHDFVPCQNKEKVVGFYDLVTTDFFAPKGGALEPGEVVTPVEPEPSEKPTIGDKEVDPAYIFSDPDNAARSDRPITYPEAGALQVEGSKGAQTITYKGISVPVPAYYTAVQNGNKVSLELNDNAAPTITETEKGPAVEIKDGKFIVRFAPNEKAAGAKLNYTLWSTTELGSEDFKSTAITISGDEHELLFPMENKPAAFFKILTNDVP